MGPTDHEQLWQAVPEGLAPVQARLREDFLRRHALAGARAGAASRILDLGCGEGHFAAMLVRAGAATGAAVEVVGVDVAAEPLRRARALHPELDLRLAEPEAPLPLEDASFDFVWAGELIEHIADTSGWLSEVRRVLRSGGMLLLSTPDHGPLRMLSMAFLPRRFDRHFDPRSDHLRFYTRRTLNALLRDFGFEEIVVSGRGGLPGARGVLLASARRRRF